MGSKTAPLKRGASGNAPIDRGQVRQAVPSPVKAVAHLDLRTALEEDQQIRDLASGSCNYLLVNYDLNLITIEIQQNKCGGMAPSPLSTSTALLSTLRFAHGWD
jgi:hypothetical protein